MKYNELSDIELVRACTDSTCWCDDLFRAVQERTHRDDFQTLIVDALSATGLDPVEFAKMFSSSETPGKTVITADHGITKQFNLSVIPLSDVQEREAEWLVTNYIPRRQITLLCGDGGVGKTFLWCSIAADLSTGRPTFLEVRPEGFKAEPEKVLVLSSEDSAEYVLRKRLRECDADLNKIIHIPLTDDRFSELKFDTQYLRALIGEHRPGLVIFDPLQAFIPQGVDMSRRNQMRHTLATIPAWCERYGSTALIIMHSNKRTGASGRNRLADSADIWDVARSVMIAGRTPTGERYLSHEKNNYGEEGQTVLYRIENGKIKVIGHTDKKDADFVAERNHEHNAKPQRDEAKETILDTLDQNSDKQMPVADLDEICIASGISRATLKRAKTELRQEGRIRVFSSGYGQEKKFHVQMS